MSSGSASNGLLTIGSGIYLSKAKSPSSSANSTENTESRLKSRNGRVAAPSVILIFGWMGAQLSHLLKYIKTYDELYPQSVKIIVRSEASFFWSSVTARKRRLQPVVEALELLGCLPPGKNCSTSVALAGIQPIVPYPRPAVLVHAFSNGGSWQLATLGEILDSRPPLADDPGSPLCISAMVLDSCPGDGGLQATQRAFSTAVRNPIVRALIGFFIRILYLIMSVQKAVLRRKLNTVDIMKAQLNNTKLLPWFGKHTRRLYIYSTKDDLIPYHEVEKHAIEAEKSGFIVKQRRFEDSAHVAHARAHPEDYWQEVQALWEEASSELHSQN